MGALGFLILDEDEIVGMEFYMAFKNRYGPSCRYERAVSIVESMRKVFKMLKGVNKVIVFINWYKESSEEEETLKKIAKNFEEYIKIIFFKSERINQGYLKTTRFHNKPIPIEVFYKIDKAINGWVKIEDSL